MLPNILLVIHLVTAVTIVVLVLLQQGKGSDMGAAFGGAFALKAELVTSGLGSHAGHGH